MKTKADLACYFPGTPYGEEEPNTASTQQEKTQARRAQVRRAQLQHRQRKANYTRQLEDDVAQLRRKIEQTEADIESLHQDNAAIREKLAARQAQVQSLPQTQSQFKAPMTIINVDLTQQFQQLVDLDTDQPNTSEAPPLPPPPEASTTSYDEMPAVTYTPPNYTVSMSMGVMGTPSFQVTRLLEKIPDKPRHPARTASSQGSANLANSLTQEQTDLVINFILS
jgi:hypothetical protein